MTKEQDMINEKYEKETLEAFKGKDELESLCKSLLNKIEAWLDDSEVTVCHETFFVDLLSLWQKADFDKLVQYEANFEQIITDDRFIRLMARKDTNEEKFEVKNTETGELITDYPSKLVLASINNPGLELTRPKLVQYSFNQTQQGYGESFAVIYKIYSKLSEDELETISYNAQRSSEKLGQDSFLSDEFI